jgi:monoamine oxidase
MKERLGIIGAGLSGLYAARRFAPDYRVTLFEARERPGGRILTTDGFDLGPSWIWPHHRRMLALCSELGLPLFPQHTAGYSLYETRDRIEAFAPPEPLSSARMTGGLGRLIDALLARLPGIALHLGEAVESLVCTEAGVTVRTAARTERFDRVLCTLPPRVVLENLRFDPPLCPETEQKMRETPTWMGHAAKCVVAFDRPFWRQYGLSGAGFSHRGPLEEFHDACTPETAALFGFIGTPTDNTDLEAEVTAQLRRLFGDAMGKITGFYCTDWRKERFSAVREDAAAPGGHPHYGLELDHCDGRIIFAGTECAFEEGGYMEGALRSIEQIRGL